MSTPAIDIAQLVGRREQFAYEQHLARSTYAYGVDLRRSAWLDRSTVGDPLMRSVDRRWNGLITNLSADALLPPGTTLSAAVMDHLLGLVRLLHAPWPSVRVLQPAVAERWPIVTPLGTTKGGSHWLIIDKDRLEALPESERTFLLASGIAHLQCDHGPLFAAHLMAHRSGRSEGFIRTLLRPWSKVCVFSADRAGLIAVNELDQARDALRAHADPAIPWLPPIPDLAERLRAVEEFSKSRLLARLRFSGPHEGWSLAPRLAKIEATAGDATDHEEAQPDTDGDDESKHPNEAPRASEPSVSDPVEEAEAEGERLAAKQAEDEQAREAAEDAVAQAKAREQALAQAWPLARCDQRLTRRLGLL
ncbi:MAG: hypothetical protein ACE37F_02255 [Nannocystaceae bacterium]|nr:hypothetical protein [bacterium]